MSCINSSWEGSCLLFDENTDQKDLIMNNVDSCGYCLVEDNINPEEDCICYEET